MQRGSSVNFQPIKSAAHAISHANREVLPEYLLPPEKSLGTIVLIDDLGQVAKTLEAKLALASRQAKRQEGYSPLWEGVINLRSPEVGEDPKSYKKSCSEVVENWCATYEKLTKHKVLRADIHLDEGRLDAETGEVLFNAHAHVMCDKTNDIGRVIKLDAPKLRKIQDFTSEITSLKRGENSLQTKRKHITHQAYKALAELGRLETQKQVGAVQEQLQQSEKSLGRLRENSKKWSDADLAKVNKIQSQLDEEPQRLAAALKVQEAQLNAKYKIDREALIASGEAKQSDHQKLKKDLAAALAEAAKVPELVASAVKAQAQIDKLAPLAALVPELKKDLILINQKVEKMEKDNATQDEKLGMAWWNNLEPSQRSHWLGVAGTAVAGDAWAAFKASDDIQQVASWTPVSVKTAPEPFSAGQAPPAPTPTPKPLLEALTASWAAMLDWVRAAGGRQEPVMPTGQYFGRVVHLDGLHCVQRTGTDKFAVHELWKLDRVPSIDDPKTEIGYQDGAGQVKGSGLGVER